MPAKAYRVRYFAKCGAVRYQKFDSLEEAQAFYDSLNGVAEIQRRVDGSDQYEMHLPPTLEF